MSGMNGRTRLPLPILWLAALLCLAGVGKAKEPADDISSCPVTQPPKPAFVPPPPYSEDRSPGFFLGSPTLWTSVRDAVQGVPLPEGGKRVKWPWFATGLSAEEKTDPAIFITGRRLDAKAQPLGVEGSDYSVLPDGRSFFASALLFPSPGCWEITAKRKDFEMKFVVWVAD